MLIVLQRRPSIIEPGGLEWEFELGFLKMGIEGGLFTVLVSDSRNSTFPAV